MTGSILLRNDGFAIFLMTGKIHLSKCPNTGTTGFGLIPAHTLKAGSRKLMPANRATNDRRSISIRTVVGQLSLKIFVYKVQQ